MAMDTDMRKGIALAAAAAMLWSISGVLIKGVSWDGFSVAGFRSLIAAGVIFLFMKRTKFRITFSSVGAVIAYACTVTCIGIANKNTTAANAVLLQFTSPVFTAILGWKLLREKVTRIDIISILMILGGMFVFVADGLSSGHIRGDLLALLAGVSFGSMCVFLRIEKDSNPVQCAFYGNLLSFLICLPFMDNPGWTFQNASLIIVLGVFQLGLSYILFTKAIRHITALQANIIPVIEPLLNPVWVLLVLGERPAPLALIGGLIVITGVIGKEILNRRTEQREALPRETDVSALDATSARHADR